MELFEESEQNAYRYAVKAAELDDTDHVIQMILGRVYLFRRKFDEAEHHITKLLELNANDADNLVQLAICFGFLGRAAEGECLFTLSDLKKTFADEITPMLISGCIGPEGDGYHFDRKLNRAAAKAYHVEEICKGVIGTH